MKPSVLYVFRPGRSQLIERIQAGESPDDMLYGYGKIDADAYDLRYIERDDTYWNWKRRIWSPLEYQILRRITTGFSLHFALDHLAEFRKADVIVSIADSVGLPIAMLKYSGVVKTPMVYFSQGLTDNLEGLPSYSRSLRVARPLYSRFLKRVERIVVLGEGARVPIMDLFGLAPEKIACAPFGVDENFWTPNPDVAAGDYILSVGSDMHRDYDTLLAALDDQPTKIVTRLEFRTDDRTSIEIASAFSDIELRDLYQRARFVVTPIRDIAQPSGQSATLQAMACAKAVILTATQGLWEPAVMRHMENCFLVQPGDADDLRRAIQFLSDHPQEAERIGQNARRTVETRYTSRHFAERIARDINTVLADKE